MNGKEIHCSSLSVRAGLELYHVGPPLDQGAHPALFYFSLSGRDSLCKDPYNQLIQFILPTPVRMFSLTLPAHENNLSPHDALQVWANEFSQGTDRLEIFLQGAQEALRFVQDNGLAQEGRIAAAGLSRGSLFATLLAAREQAIGAVLGFAPVTVLGATQEFQNMQKLPLVQKYRIDAYARELANKKIRFFIGNRDVRVSTHHCFTCLEKLIEASYEQGVRSPPMELIMYPAIGHLGHGTPPHIFNQGALWLREFWQ